MRGGRGEVTEAEVEFTKEKEKKQIIVGLYRVEKARTGGSGRVEFHG